VSDFPPIYGITLREQFYRRQITEKHLTERGLQAQWIYGFNGATTGLRASVAHEYKPDGTPIYMHPSVLAVALSHVFALQWACMQGSDEFFIVEDDVVLCDKFKDKWLELRTHVPNEIGVIQAAVACWEDKPAIGINEFLEHRHWPFCAACNWWRRDTAELAQKVIFPLNSPIDILYTSRVFPFVGHAITKERLAYDHSLLARSGKWPSASVTFGGVEKP